MKAFTLTVFAALLIALSPAAQQPQDKGEVALKAAMDKEVLDGNLQAAIEQYRKLAAAFRGNRSVAAQALVRMGQCYEKLGDAEARKAYERVVREYGDQNGAAETARGRLAAMGQEGGKSITAQLIAKGPKLGLVGRITQDGKLYVFSELGSCDIAVADLQTGAMRRLNAVAADSACAVAPVPSRSGKQIVYARRHHQGAETELQVINVDGSGSRILPLKLKTGDRVTPADWSPDDESILVSGYTREPYQPGLAMVNVSSGELRWLLTTNMATDIAGFSPDGRFVAYAAPAGPIKNGVSDWDIFLLDAQTGSKSVLVSGTGADRHPVWVPGSDTIVFLSNRNGKNAFWKVRVRDGQAAGAPVMIKPDAEDFSLAGISRDGALVYGIPHRLSDIYQATVDPQTLCVQDTPARIIESYVGHNSQPR